jgi:AcrR family transcriptional regulator
MWKPEPASMAERKRQVVREELGGAALRLLAINGFECTTIDQIVAAAGVSRRTFFRYFKSKEDVIIVFLGDLGKFVLEALAARPAEEPPGAAIRAALSVIVDGFSEDPAKSVALTNLMIGTPALRARYLDRQAELQAGLAVELARRSGTDPATDPRSDLTAAVALKAFDVTLARWAAGGGTEDFGTILDESFALLPTLLDR